MPYQADSEGRMVPSLPRRCLYAEGGAGCQLRIGYQRDRKTGPCFPLAVLRCRTHKRASTLYPPGHVPHGRVAIAPVDAQGDVIRPASARAIVGGAAWDVTIFAAALDAADGTLWPKETPERNGDAPAVPDPRRRRTQGRHLSLVVELLGVAPALNLRRREGMARALGIPCLELQEAARALEACTGLRGEGRIITRTLGLLRPSRGLVDRLLSAGELAGLWGAPRRWDPGGIERPAFRRSEARS